MCKFETPENGTAGTQHFDAMKQRVQYYLTKGIFITSSFLFFQSQTCFQPKQKSQLLVIAQTQAPRSNLRKPRAHRR
jgi:hypothetical protein